MMNRKSLFPKSLLKSLYKLKTRRLDMDYLYVSCFQFLWAYTFIAPCAYLQMKKGEWILSIRRYLVKLDIIQVNSLNIESLVGNLCLEQSQVIHYLSRGNTNQDANIARFFFPNFPFVNNNCTYQVADLFTVDIDLSTRKFVNANMDEANLTASETLILLWFNTIATQHVKLHSFANWGTNNDDTMKERNSFLHRSSVVTAVYNYFGYSSFPNFFKRWRRQGILSSCWDPNALICCFDHGMRDGITQHAQIYDLIPHSRFVNFAVKVRVIFFKEFGKHKHLFPGIHAHCGWM